MSETELLDDRIRVLGRGHLDTLTTRHNLAWWRGEAVGAAAALAELLDDMLRVLGPDHPYTLTTRNDVKVGQAPGQWWKPERASAGSGWDNRSR